MPSLATMEIFAISIGTPTPLPDFEATVQSVFSQAVNVVVNGSCDLISIFAKDKISQPGDIQLAASNTNCMSHFFPSQHIHCSQNKIHLQETNASISLEHAQIVDCSLPIFGLNNRSKLNQEIEVLRTILRSAEVQRLPITPVEKYLHLSLIQTASALSSATIGVDLLKAKQAIQSLIGAGSGLTPGGDDILVGYLASLHIVGSNNQTQHPLFPDLQNYVNEISHKTNAISRKYLTLSTRGYFSTVIIDLIKSICKNSQSSCIMDNAERLLNIGHSSGFYTLLGIVTGLESCVSSQQAFTYAETYTSIRSKL